ncbi:hypothetical protein DFJ73DRAFT_24210 [Zopfochytrium polystomum]|nr:hypothetical protein DFJ73DRAFT_24210 [Zopfochytrium polystomum]
MPSTSAKPREPKKRPDRRSVTSETSVAATITPTEEDHAMAVELFDPFAFLLDDHVHHWRAKRPVPPPYLLHNGSERYLSNFGPVFDEYHFCPVVPTAAAAALGMTLRDAQRAMQRLRSLQFDAAKHARRVVQNSARHDYNNGGYWMIWGILGLRRVVKALQRVQLEGPRAVLLDDPADDQVEEDDVKEALRYPVGINLSRPLTEWTIEAWDAVLTMAEASVERWANNLCVYGSEKAAQKAYIKARTRFMKFACDRQPWEKNRRDNNRRGVSPLVGDDRLVGNSSVKNMSSKEVIDRYLDEPICY